MKHHTLFRTHNNYITIRDRTNPQNTHKKLIIKPEQIQTIINQQKPNTDIYIQKYPTDKKINTIILDLDNKHDLQQCLQDASKLMLHIEDNGLDTAIVESGNKGYHVYIRIPLTDFKGYGKPSYTRNLFNSFIEYLIGGSERYESLDKVNTGAGLKGNIRVVGSVHPVTGKRCRLLEGYSGYSLSQSYIDECLCSAIKYAEVKEDERRSQLDSIESVKLQYDNDYIRDNDLRELLPRLFGGEIKHYGNYSMMRCPWHDDSNPSLMVGKEWFKCRGCGVKGNIWFLINKGYLDRNHL